MKNLVVLSGAGISAESGIATFRDSDGLWEGHDVMEVATPEGFLKNPLLVQEFYNQRRKQLLNCMPNKGHLGLVDLEATFQVDIITQNVDDLHERAGSKNVLHLHGELRKARSTKNIDLVYDWDKDIEIGDKCEDGSQLRPHIVWFGEAVPMLDLAIEKCRNADILVVIGTSLVVYPAASLLNYVKNGIPIYVIDPKKPTVYGIDNFNYIQKKAGEGVEQLKLLLLS